jgi:hypothetical protein
VAVNIAQASGRRGEPLCRPPLTVGIDLAGYQGYSDRAFEVVPKLDIGRNNVMRQYHFDRSADPIKPEKIETLVISLRGRVQLLDDDIKAEEERTHCKDRRDASYSILARTLIARRDNLSATIAALQERLGALEAPEWNYS